MDDKALKKATKHAIDIEFLTLYIEDRLNGTGKVIEKYGRKEALRILRSGTW